MWNPFNLYIYSNQPTQSSTQSYYVASKKLDDFTKILRSKCEVLILWSDFWHGSHTYTSSDTILHKVEAIILSHLKKLVDFAKRGLNMSFLILVSGRVQPTYVSSHTSLNKVAAILLIHV